MSRDCRAGGAAAGTLQTSAWYASAGYASFFVVGAIAVHGFKTALGGRPILDGATIADQVRYLPASPFFS